MKNDIRNAFEKISPVRSDDEIFTNVIRRSNMNTDKKKNIKLRKAIITPVAAVIGLFATAVTAGAIYEGIQYLQRSEYGQIEEIEEKINTFVYEDSTENIKMTVEEVLSDGQKTIMSVHYEALNDTGKAWLDNAVLGNEINKIGSLRIADDSINVSHSIGTFEIDEYRTDYDRYFYIELEAFNEPLNTDSVTLLYSLDTGGKSTEISISDICRRRRYKLKSDKHGTDLFTPEYIDISDLTYTVYGMNNAVYVEERDERGYRIYFVIPDDYDIDFSFVLADGSVFETMPHSYFGSIEASEETMFTDLKICHGNYDTFVEEEQRWKYIFPSQEIVGVNICGVTYELVPIE